MSNLPSVKNSDKYPIQPVYVPETVKLSPDEKRAIEAGGGLSIKAHADVDLIARLEPIVNEAYIIRGQKIKEETYFDTVSQFASEVKKTFTTFTVEQIAEAVRMGALGKFEDDEKAPSERILHISVYGLCKWCWMWNDKIKREAVAKRNKAIDDEEKQATEATKQEFTLKFKDDIQATFEEWKEFEILYPDKEYYYSAMYEFLEKEFGPLKLEVKTKLWEQAEQELNAEALSEEDKRLKRFYKADFEEKQKTRKKMRAKTLALEFVFTFFRDQGKERIFI